jgi:hypothetical protein
VGGGAAGEFDTVTPSPPKAKSISAAKPWLNKSSFKLVSH